MTKSGRKFNWTIAIFFSLIMMLAMPLIASAQGRGYGRGRGNNRWDKCGKFVNCHDARDGRWDNRGPRGSRIGGRYNRRNRVRFDRDGDGDFDRFDRRIQRRQNRNTRWQIRNTRRNGRNRY